MNRVRQFTLCGALLAIPFLSLNADDGKLKPCASTKPKRIKIDAAGADFDASALPHLKLDLSSLMASLQELEITLAQLPSIEIPPIEVILPTMEIDLSDNASLLNLEVAATSFDLPALMAGAMPPLPQVPPIEIPEIDLEWLAIDCNASAEAIFQYLSDEEKARLDALRTLAAGGVNQAIAAYNETVRMKARPSLRYEAIRQLGNFLHDARVVPLLGEAAKSDKNIEVRKKAIALLGQCDDPRSLKILEDIVLN